MRLVASLALVACSSGYMPRTPDHVAVIIRDGKPVYVRDGRTFDPGLGGGLVDAVHGNPTAVAAAAEFRSRQITGLVSMLLGTAASIGGLTWGTAVAATDRPSSQLELPGGLLIVGLVAMVVGTYYLSTAQPYQWDAINIYNDGAASSVGPPMPALAPPGPPGYTGTGATESLHMR